MVDGKCITDNYKVLKASMEALIKNPEMKRFVSDYLKTKKMCKNAVKKLPFVMRYIPD